jgi:DNA-binding MurR/RpiR family transcriptional regulator
MPREGEAASAAAAAATAGQAASAAGGPSGAGSAGFLVRVRGLLPALSRAEALVAGRVLEDPEGAAALTITELARECGTSEATVLRFCRTAGLHGYADLRIALAAEAARSLSADGAPPIGSDIGPGEDLARVVEKIAWADARAVEETAQQLDVAALERAVEAIAAARRIDVYGVGASAFVAGDLQQKLHRIRRTAFAWTDAHMALTSAALLERTDVAVGVSHTGTTIDIVEALREAGRRGATTVALTNFPRSPLAIAADVVLTTAARETTFRSGATASRIAQLTIVDCLFVGVAQRTYADARDALERTHAAVRHRRTGAAG